MMADMTVFPVSFDKTPGFAYNHNGMEKDTIEYTQK